MPENRLDPSSPRQVVGPRIIHATGQLRPEMVESVLRTKETPQRGVSTEDAPPDHAILRGNDTRPVLSLCPMMLSRFIWILPDESGPIAPMHRGVSESAANSPLTSLRRNNRKSPKKHRRHLTPHVRGVQSVVGGDRRAVLAGRGPIGTRRRGHDRPKERPNAGGMICAT